MAKKNIKVRDLKPKKDAKGGGPGGPHKVYGAATGSAPTGAATGSAPTGAATGALTGALPPS